MKAAALAALPTGSLLTTAGGTVWHRDSDGLWTRLQDGARRSGKWLTQNVQPWKVQRGDRLLFEDLLSQVARLGG